MQRTAVRDYARQQLTVPNFSQAVHLLRGFIGTQQMRCIGDACRGEEGDWFKAKVIELAGIVDRMPKVYEQEGLGDKATVHLHYFTASADFYITEKDSELEQLQAYGMANIGHGGELGYISLVEILKCGAELDMHFRPCTLADVDKTYEQLKREIAEVAPAVEAKAEAGSGYRIEKHRHTKKGFDMFIVILAAKVERPEYEKLLASCERAGGWYSRKWGRTPGGFAFEEEAKASDWARVAVG